MKVIFWILIGLISLWTEATASSYLRIWDLKIDLVFIVLLLLMLRWKSSFLLFYGLVLGIITDALSHSMLGVYGLSYFLILSLTRWIGEWFYDNNIFSTFLFVALLSLLEGICALTLLKLLTPTLSWNTLFISVLVPLSLIHGLLSPPLLMIIIRVERILKLAPEDNIQTSSSSP